MTSLINWFTKKKIIIFSFFVTVTFFLFYYLNTVSSCRHEKYCSSITEYVVIYLLPFISVFIISLIVFRLQEPVFSSWKNFSMWVIPFVIVIITIFPTRTHGLDFFPIIKGTVSVVLSIIYLAISVILIIYKSLKVKQKEIGEI